MKKQSIIYLLSFFIPLSILCLIAVSLGLTPFGDNNLLVSDLRSQYTPFFSYFRQILSGEANLFYSFSIGMGDSILPLAAYYLLSPFNLLLLIRLPLDQLVLLIIGLKIASISLSMQFYLTKTYQKSEWKQLVFSLSYAFSGFVGIYAINLMWLDGLIFLPLVVLSLQRLIETKKGVLYSLAILGAIVTNYYMGYMICLFAVVYFFYWTGKTQVYASVKEYFKTFIHFVKYSLLGGMMSMFILVPALRGMLNTGKSEFSYYTYLPFPRFGLDFFMQLGLDSTSYSSRLSHLPSFYVGALSILMCALYFQLPFGKKEKWLKAGLIGTIFLSFFIQTFNAVWHMFQFAAGFPFRNSYMLSFVLLLICYETWGKRAEITPKMLGRTVAILIILLLSGYATMHWLNPSFASAYQIDIQPKLLLLSVFLFIFNALLLTKTKKKWAVICLFTLLAVDTSYNFYQMIASIPFGSSAQFVKKEETLSALIEQTNTDTKEFWRVENNLQQEYIGYNDSLLMNFYDLPSYSSTLNEKLRVTLQDLGLFSRNERRISDIGLTSFTSFLLNVNYEITSRPNYMNSLVIAKIDENYVLQKNHVTSSIGYILPQAVNDIEFLAKNGYENQNKLAQTIMNDQEFMLFEPNSFQQVSNQKWRLTAENTGDLFIYLPKKSNWNVGITVNNTPQTQRVTVTEKGLIELTNVKKGDEVELSFSDLNTTTLPEESIRVLKQDSLEQVIHEMNSNRVDLQYHKRKNQFLGTFNARKDGLLFLSIPYDEEWVVKIDGKKVETKAILNQSFIGVPVTIGEHKLEVVYQPKSFYQSAVVSFVAGILLVMVGFIDYKRKD
ncbi:MAG: YfhO family protein [Streptococcaceae bacterium]|jgi:uncharacterized membrane protein YfhO|nr:YfhO family protein [Streptococcaceae bacterium]